MTIFIGTFEATSQYLPVLEHICDEHGGSILVTERGISYELPARQEEQETTLRLVHGVVGPVSAELHPELLQQAA